MYLTTTHNLYFDQVWADKDLPGHLDRLISTIGLRHIDHLMNSDQHNKCDIWRNNFTCPISSDSIYNVLKFDLFKNI